jgi:hypothetical protein
MNYPTETDNPAKATTYNGWKNYETWNVALYMGNDYESYQIALGCRDYEDYRIRIVKTLTPDGVDLWGDELDIEALDETIKELRN